MPNGKEEMLRCEQVFRQICWLEERFWPDVDGMGEEDETSRYEDGFGAPPGMHAPVNGNGQQGVPDSNQGVTFGGSSNGISEATGGAST